MTNPTALVQKLWNYCNTLRDDGLSYGDYMEQLIPRSRDWFLKMSDRKKNSVAPLLKASTAEGSMVTLGARVDSGRIRQFRNLFRIGSLDQKHRESVQNTSFPHLQIRQNPAKAS